MKLNYLVIGAIRNSLLDSVELAFFNKLSKSSHQDDKTTKPKKSILSFKMFHRKINCFLKVNMFHYSNL